LRRRLARLLSCHEALVGEADLRFQDRQIRDVGTHSARPITVTPGNAVSGLAGRHCVMLRDHTPQRPRAGEVSMHLSRLEPGLSAIFVLAVLLACGGSTNSANSPADYNNENSDATGSDDTQSSS